MHLIPCRVHRDATVLIGTLCTLSPVTLAERPLRTSWTPFHGYPMVSQCKKWITESCMYLLRRWLFKLRIYFMGLGFQLAEELSTPRPFMVTRIPVPYYRHLVVKFYKLEVEEQVRIFNRFKRRIRTTIVIESTVQEGKPDKLLNYDGVQFSFPLYNYNLKNQDVICRVLLETYLDYLNEVT